MHASNGWVSEDAARTVQASREKLVARLAHASHDDGLCEPLEGVRLQRVSAPMDLGL